jgi:hypothetical protein
MDEKENIAWHKLWCSVWFLNNPHVKCEYLNEEKLFSINIYINNNTFTFFSEKEDLFYIDLWNFLEKQGASVKDAIEIS